MSARIAVGGRLAWTSETHSPVSLVGPSDSTIVVGQVRHEADTVD